MLDNDLRHLACPEESIIDGGDSGAVVDGPWLGMGTGRLGAKDGAVLGVRVSVVVASGMVVIKSGQELTAPIKGFK